jgi:hypothetical protein
MRITLVGAIAIAGVALLVLVLLNLNRGDSGKPDGPPNPPDDRVPSTLLGQSAGTILHPGA